MKKIIIMSTILLLNGCVDTQKEIYQEHEPIDEYDHLLCSDSATIRSVDIPRFESISTPIGKYKTTIHLEIDGKQKKLSFISLTNGYGTTQSGSLLKDIVSNKARGDTSYYVTISNSTTDEFPEMKVWIMQPNLTVADYLVAISIKSEKEPEKYYIAEDANCKKLSL